MVREKKAGAFPLIMVEFLSVACHESCHTGARSKVLSLPIPQYRGGVGTFSTEEEDDVNDSCMNCRCSNYECSHG